jgi:AraC-like DNA-binding protein
MPPSDTPLSRYVAVDTRSADEARDAVGRIFCPHFLSPLGRTCVGFHARHHSAAQTGYSVNFVSYGAEVEIDPGELEHFYLVQLPLRGQARVRCGTLAVEADVSRRASLLSPTLSTRMTWSAGCEKLIVLIDRAALEQQFEVLTHESRRSVQFETGIDLETPSGLAVGRHAEMMLTAAEAGAAMPDAYRVLLRDGMTTLLLTSQPSSVSRIFSQPVREADPIAVRRAQDFMAANAHRAIAMADIAAAAGVPLRSLQDAYRRARGMTLSGGILSLRLDLFRASLLSRDETCSVAEAAFAAGFGHLGRAAAAYRQRFGEAPSDTVVRRRS